MNGFRAWDKLLKKYYTGKDLVVNQFGQVMLIGSKALIYTMDRYDIEWETPFKDFNGRVIHQNDTLENPDSGIGTVKMLNGSWAVDFKRELIRLHEASQNSEIDGTIHDDEKN